MQMENNNFEKALTNVTFALNRIMDSLDGYKKRGNASSKYIEIQEKNIIDIFQFIECAQNIIDFNLSDYFYQISMWRYECNKLFKALIFWKQCCLSAWEQSDRWQELYKDSISRINELEQQVLSLKQNK